MGQIIRRHLNGYLVTGQDLDKVHSELAGNVCQNGVSVTDIYIEHSIRQCIGDDALNLDYVVLCQVVNLPKVDTLHVPVFAGFVRNSLAHLGKL